MMKTIWTETPKGEEAQQEWIGSQSRHRLPMVQITKNGCLKINKPLQELLPPYFQLSYSPQNQELLLRESTLEDGGIRMGKTFVKLLPLSRKLRHPLSLNAQRLKRVGCAFFLYYNPIGRR